MKITSEITHKDDYKSVQQCLDDEKAFLAEQEKEKLKQAEAEKKRSAQEKEIKDAFKNAYKLLDNYRKENKKSVYLTFDSNTMFFGF